MTVHLGSRALPRHAGSPRRYPRRRPLGVDLTALIGGVGFGAVVAQWLITMPSVTTGAGAARVRPSLGNVLLAAGQLSGLAAAYFALIGLLLVARVPVLEQTLGLDRLLRTHRKLGPWLGYAMLAHVALVTLGYAANQHSGPLTQLWAQVSTYEWVWLAAIGVVLILLAGLASWRVIRARISYETWWLLHLTMYLGIAFAFLHQLTNGAAFIRHPVARTLWTVFFLGVFGCLLAYRAGLPLARAWRHRLRVVAVVREAPGVHSVVLTGDRLDDLPLAGGQFALWRFLTPTLWWQAHPYSVSGLVRGGRLRITVKDSGDHSGALRRLRPGTGVLMEGPYGVFTAAAREPGYPVLLVAGGVGVTPIRALLEDLPRDARPVVLYRARRSVDILFRDEIETLVAARGGRVAYLVGDRDRQPLTASRLLSLVPDLARRSIYVCGPGSMVAGVVSAARAVGVPARRVHVEAFTFHGE
ncbi:MAG TPA: ferredoxin reductase family protein [Micromonosporaceae bacterium]